MTAAALAAARLRGDRPSASAASLARGSCGRVPAVGRGAGPAGAPRGRHRRRGTRPAAPGTPAARVRGMAVRAPPSGRRSRGGRTRRPRVTVSLSWALARVVQATLAVRRLVRSPLGEGPEGSVIVGGEDVMLAAAGLTRPTLVVSAGALARLDDAELAAAMAHERAHIRRFHRYVLLFAEVCRVLGRPLPGTARAVRQLRFHIERDADRCAVRERTDRLALASAICKAATGAPPARASRPSAATARPPACASCSRTPPRRAPAAACERWRRRPWRSRSARRCRCRRPSARWIRSRCAGGRATARAPRSLPLCAGRPSRGAAAGSARPRLASAGCETV